jgi:TusA-related sulfurtransferase
MGDIIIIHSDEPGAVHNIPLTRADDAYVHNNN